MADRLNPKQVSLRYRPIDRWVGPAEYDRVHSPYRATNRATLMQLKHELAQIGVASAVIQMDLEESEIRLDGEPRANAKPKTGRVAVSFEHPDQGPLTYPCYRFHSAWDNLRAIVLTLEALRAVDRHGAARTGQQYGGWRALPEGTGLETTVESAARTIVEVAWPDEDEDTIGMALDVEDLAVDAIRAARTRSHPDKPTGSDRLFHKVQQAAKVLRRHHGMEARDG